MSPRVHDLIDSLEPSIQDFSPVTLISQTDGNVLGTYFLILPPPKLNAVIVEETEFSSSTSLKFLAFWAKQLGTSSRLVAAYIVGDGSLASTLQINEEMTNRLADAARRAYITARLRELIENDLAIPEKYVGFLESGNGEILSDDSVAATTENNERFVFSTDATGTHVSATDAQGEQFYAATLDSTGQANLTQYGTDASSFQIFMDQAVNSFALEQRSPTGELEQLQVDRT